MADLLHKVYDSLNGLNLKDIIIYDFRGISPYYDYQILASASSERQANASISHIKNAIPEDMDIHVEGTQNSRWILIDLKSIIIHVMHNEDREFYNLEKIFFEREKIIIGENNGL